MANNYVWLLAVQAGEEIIPAQATDISPMPGDLAELDCGRIGRVIFGGLYKQDEADYTKAISLLKPYEVVAHYPRRLLKEADVDADS